VSTSYSTQAGIAAPIKGHPAGWPFTWHLMTV